ncbi:FYVE zinc finger-domain-containing protein [Lyophyllum atratum]|nr:FYVE zinc finger-domain-containing protein [Lyophyllum atratum]
MPDPVPYQAYRSKRHSHNLSGNLHSASPASVSQPSSAIISPPPSPQLLDNDEESLSGCVVPNGHSSPLVNPGPVTHQLPSPQESIDIHAHTPSPRPSSHSSAAGSSPDVASSTPVMMSSIAASSSAGPSSSPQLSPAKKASTFRRVPLRNARPSLPSSPLGPNHPSPSHSRNESISSVNQNTSPLHDPVVRSPPQMLDTWSRLITSQAGVVDPVDRQLPPMDMPASERQTNFSPETLPPPIQATQSTSSAHVANTATSSSNGSLPPSNRPTQRTQAPYRPGFQPKGLYRPLTDDFIAIRRLKRDGEGEGGKGPGMKRVERTKLLRRLEKLIHLHFPPSTANNVANVESIGRVKKRPRTGGGSEVDIPTVNRRASSFFDFDIRNISISDAGGLWRGVVGGGEVHDIRAAEQRITPWQDDADVVKCPLCSTSFHPLTNRKHHCRLCGQIICSLPVKRPHRPVPCSLLFVVDPKTKKIEEVGEGVDYGVRRRRLDSGGGVDAGGGAHAEEEKFLKGVRICRTCRPILLRQQYQQEVAHVPTFAKLYEAFIGLEQEIEESLPQFQELVLSLSHNDQPTKEASATRKRLLEAFAQYDGLAKRMRKLPCPNGPGSSQDRVQVAIMTRASLFLQKNMFPLQSLPTPKKTAPQGSGTAAPFNDAGHHLDPDSEMALALQPLLEQEALLESFVEEAKAQRKFEDVKTLKANLREIRVEIDKIVVNAEGGM